MAQLEIDSFYVKFKNLLRAERDATLTIKSDSGRAFVTLCVDLGHVLSDPGQQQHQQKPRNGPARQRRREKRAATRELAAEEANKPVEETAKEENAKVDINLSGAVKATDNIVNAAGKATLIDENEKSEAEEAKEETGKVNKNLSGAVKAAAGEATLNIEKK